MFRVVPSFRQWRAEDLICVGFAYEPVSNQAKALVEMLRDHVPPDEVSSLPVVLQVKQARHHAKQSRPRGQSVDQSAPGRLAGSSPPDSGKTNRPLYVGLGMDDQNVFVRSAGGKSNAPTAMATPTDGPGLPQAADASAVEQLVEDRLRKMQVRPSPHP